MNELCKEQSYIMALNTILSLIDENEIAFGNGIHWALGKLEEACTIADKEVNIVKFGNWISVDDKLPETDDVYLVYLGKSEKRIIDCYFEKERGDNGEFGEYIINLHTDGSYRWTESHWNKKNGVTHWMPMPEMPGGKR